MDKQVKDGYALFIPRLVSTTKRNLGEVVTSDEDLIGLAGQGGLLEGSDTETETWMTRT